MPIFPPPSCFSIHPSSNILIYCVFVTFIQQIIQASLVALTVANVVNTRKVYEAYLAPEYVKQTHTITADRFPQFFSNYELVIILFLLLSKKEPSSFWLFLKN